MSTRNRFVKGSGCYTCKDCGKKTRSVGNGDNEHIGLCVRCYDKAGDENSVSDGYMTQEQFDAKWNVSPASPTPTEKVRVSVSITWGREFNGEYNALTPGKGCYVEVMEHEPVLATRGAGFRGCPLGSGTTVEAAILDFVSRGRHEYLGKQRLERAMIEVVRTNDYRTPTEVTPVQATRTITLPNGTVATVSSPSSEEVPTVTATETAKPKVAVSSVKSVQVDELSSSRERKRIAESVKESGIRWTPIRLALCKALVSLNATSHMGAIDRAAIAKRAKVEESQVMHTLYKDQPLGVGDFVRSHRDENNTLLYYLTGKGKREFEKVSKA